MQNWSNLQLPSLCYHSLPQGHPDTNADFRLLESQDGTATFESVTCKGFYIGIQNKTVLQTTLNIFLVVSVALSPGLHAIQIDVYLGRQKGGRGFRTSLGPFLVSVQVSDVCEMENLMFAKNACAKCILSVRGPSSPLSTYLSRQWHHWCDRRSWLFPSVFAYCKWSKSWRCELPLQQKKIPSLLEYSIIFWAQCYALFFEQLP